MEGTQESRNQSSHSPIPTDTQTAPSEVPLEDATKKVPKRKATAACWNHFTHDKDLGKAICNHCGIAYAYVSSKTHGTSNLKNHISVCPGIPSNVDKKQKTLVYGTASDDGTISLKLADFSQDKCRQALAKMIAIMELPFSFTDHPQFREFMGVACPRFKVPSRFTIARDVKEIFEFEKAKLKSLLSLNKQMVAFTTDTWTSIQNLNYMCVTAHYINDEWLLNKKIVSFAKIQDHKGETIGKALEDCMKDWGILNISCVTVDNATSNNTALSYLRRVVSLSSGCTMLGGAYMHMRCAAHILNLIVGDGMKFIDASITRIRYACKYVRGSPARLATFQKCAEDANITSTQKLVIDVPTRWNSTYLMLKVAEKYENAFNRLELIDDAFVACSVSEEGNEDSSTSSLSNKGPPTLEDWKRARVFVKFLEIFYDATLCFSASLHTTSNLFFPKFVVIKNHLLKWSVGEDDVLRNMAGTMMKKFDKYWDVDTSLNYVLLVANFLDPRYKFEYMHFYFEEAHSDSYADAIVDKVRDLVKKLIDQYSQMHVVHDGTEVRSDATNSASSSISVDFEDRFKMKVRQKQRGQTKNELQRYEDDECEDDSKDFDILKWWSLKASKYRTLSTIARDILAIPVSTVSSESAFSTGGRVIHPSRSALADTTVEALICTQSWLAAPQRQKSTTMQSDEQVLEEVEAPELEAIHCDDQDYFRSMLGGGYL